MKRWMKHRLYQPTEPVPIFSQDSLVALKRKM